MSERVQYFSDLIRRGVSATEARRAADERYPRTPAPAPARRPAPPRTPQASPAPAPPPAPIAPAPPAAAPPEPPIDVAAVWRRWGTGAPTGPSDRPGAPSGPAAPPASPLPDRPTAPLPEGAPPTVRPRDFERIDAAALSAALGTEQ